MVTGVLGINLKVELLEQKLYIYIITFLLALSTLLTKCGPAVVVFFLRHLPGLFLFHQPQPIGCREKPGTVKCTHCQGSG